MKTTLNNYTIDDFVKIKPIIYEYCVNLTQKKSETFRYRDFSDADDLYQEVFLYVHDLYFNKPKELLEEGKFIQIMKNCTFYTYHRRLTLKNAAIYRQLNRIDDSPTDFFKLEQVFFENPKQYVDFKESIDYLFYTNQLKPIEQKALSMFLDGYRIREIEEKLERKPGFVTYLIKVKVSRILKSDKLKLPNPNDKIKKLKSSSSPKLVEDDVKFLKTKINNYDQVFSLKKSNEKFIKMYSLYLQGIGLDYLAKEFNSSKHQISVELFRIKQKIKKYA